MRLSRLDSDGHLPSASASLFAQSPSQSPETIDLPPRTPSHAARLLVPLAWLNNDMPGWATSRRRGLPRPVTATTVPQRRFRSAASGEGELLPSAGGAGRAPVEGVGQEEVLPEHEEDGGEDAGDEGAAQALALAVPRAVEAIGGGVVAADGHRHLRHHPCQHPSRPLC